MAAVYIHNALFSPEPAPSISHGTGQRPQTGVGVTGRAAPHQRQLSSHSTATLTTNATHYSSSQPTEPLFYSAASVSSAYHDLLARQPAHPNELQLGWDSGLRLDGDPVTLSELRGVRELALRKRLRRLVMFKLPLEVLIGSWATYNTVRYFISFSIYSAHLRQIFSLVLGSSSVLSLALLLSSAILVPLSPPSWQRYNSFSFPVFRYARNLLPYLSSFFLIGPAAVNLALVIFWSYAQDDTLRLSGKCDWEIDVIWSGTGSQCVYRHSTTWGGWLAGSILRLVITVFVLIMYHIVSHLYDQARRRAARYFPVMKSLGHITLPVSPALQPMMTSTSASTSTSTSPSLSPFFPSSTTGNYLSSPGLSPFFAQASRRQQQLEGGGAGRTSVSDSGHGSVLSGDRRSIRSSKSRIMSTKEGPQAVSRNSLSSTTDQGHLTSEESLTEEGHSASLRRASTSVEGGHQDSGSGSAVGHSQAESQTDPDLMGFVDRFRSLISQIARETEEGMEFARTDNPRATAVLQPAGPINLNSDSDDEFEDDLESGDEYDRSLTPEEYITMLGGFVRRMPTIESLGSREVTSLTGSNSNSGRGGGAASTSLGSNSRPPTRTNTLMSEDQYSLSVSLPPSRSNSLNHWRSGEREIVGRERERETGTPHSNSGSQRSVGRSASDGSRRTRSCTASSTAPSPVQVDFAHAENDDDS